MEWVANTLVPAEHVIPITNTWNLPWETLAAIPETLLTDWRWLIEAMDVKSGQTLLVRGGTSSVGMAAISLAVLRLNVPRAIYIVLPSSKTIPLKSLRFTFLF